MFSMALALAVERPVVRNGGFAMPAGRGAGGDPARGQGLSEPIGVIAPVRKQDRRRRQCLNQQRGPFVIAGLPLGQRKTYRAATAIADSLSLLDTAPVQRHADLPLKRYGQLARMLITCDSPAQFQNIFALPTRFPALFRCQHSDRMARRVDLMIAAFRQHLDALAGLSDFADLIATVMPRWLRTRPSFR